MIWTWTNGRRTIEPLDKLAWDKWFPEKNIWKNDFVDEIYLHAIPFYFRSTLYLIDLIRVEYVAVLAF